MIIIARTRTIRRGGYIWRIELPFGWEIRRQRPSCAIVTY